MNTAALKTFAPAVRVHLMEAVTRKLDYVLTAQTPDYLSTFAPQVAELRKLAEADRNGLIERVAYTSFANTPRPSAPSSSRRPDRVSGKVRR